jgi:hypothetical protein
MNPSSPNLTPPIRVCEAHLCRIFWAEAIWEQYFTHEFDLLYRQMNMTFFNDRTGMQCIWQQEMYFVPGGAANDDDLVCRASFFYGRQLERCASGCPDPKEIRIGDVYYRLNGKGARPCVHCQSGEPTAYSR